MQRDSTKTKRRVRRWNAKAELKARCTAVVRRLRVKAEFEGSSAKAECEGRLRRQTAMAEYAKTVYEGRLVRQIGSGSNEEQIACVEHALGL